MDISTTKTYFLDGSLETELHQRGVSTEHPLWSTLALFDYAEHIKLIHQAYIRSGANIITTNTTATHRRSLARVGLAQEVRYINQFATELAVQAREETATDSSVLIAGAMTTLAEPDRLDLIPDTDTLYREHSEQAQLLAATAIDFFLLKGFTTIREATAAAKAVQATGKPFILSFLTGKPEHLLSGEPLDAAVTAVEAYSPLGYCINCILPAEASANIQVLRRLTERPIGAYANCTAWTGFDQPRNMTEAERIADYAHYCAQWQQLGAQMIGGCCGTTVAHTAAYSQIPTEGVL